MCALLYYTALCCTIMCYSVLYCNLPAHEPIQYHAHARLPSRFLRLLRNLPNPTIKKEFRRRAAQFDPIVLFSRRGECPRTRVSPRIARPQILNHADSHCADWPSRVLPHGAEIIDDGPMAWCSLRGALNLSRGVLCCSILYG